MQVLEALALAEPPPEVHDSLDPDHEWILSTAKAELGSFRVSCHLSVVAAVCRPKPVHVRDSSSEWDRQRDSSERNAALSSCMHMPCNLLGRRASSRHDVDHRADVQSCL